MKNLICFAIAGTLLAACSNEEIVPTEQSPAAGGDICFSLAVAESRGDTANVSTIAAKGFWCRAVKDDGTNYWSTAPNGVLHFVRNETTGAYVAEMPTGVEIDMRWPASETLSFYASNLDPSDLAMDTSNPPKYVNFTAATNVPEQKDFVYATNKGTIDDFTTTIPLNFKHALTQVVIRAKNSNSQYTVKVKGYRIGHMVCTSTFTYPTAVNGSTATAVAGNWSNYNSSTVNAIYSGLYGGYNVTNSSIHDTTAGDYILLGSDYQTISAKNDQSGMLMMPETITGFGYGSSGFVNWDQGAYIALLVQIDMANGTPLYPALAKDPDTGLSSSDNRISYQNQPLYYGYVYVVPVNSAGQFRLDDYIGQKVIYNLDFSAGLGKVGPLAQTIVDPSTYDPEYNTGGETTDYTFTDPYTRKTGVLEGDITVTATVTNWDDTTYSGDNSTLKTM
jgi:hypothetical protein